MSHSATLRISAKIENLDSVRDFVRQRAPLLGADEDTVFAFVLAADEAVTNSIEHGYGEQPREFSRQDDWVELALWREGEDILARISDRAPAFDPTAVPNPDLDIPLEARLPGGLGLFLIRQYMDDVSHRALPGKGNELTLRRRAHAQHDANLR